MATLMEDPVILPSSKVSIDRQTIKVHLLSDPKDPFNREPLKIEDVIPSKHGFFLWAARVLSR
jgi:ubiquitin conjugation factor E4 B